MRPTPSSSPLRVLIVDDDRDTADSLAALLNLWGHAATVAYDGPRALEAARVCRPDVVVLDLAMPHLDGYGVARRLREQDARLVALTGHGLPQDRRRCEEEGFDYFLLKPADPEALREVLGRMAPRQAPSPLGEPAATLGRAGSPHFGAPRGPVHRG